MKKDLTPEQMDAREARNALARARSAKRRTFLEDHLPLTYANATALYATRKKGADHFKIRADISLYKVKTDFVVKDSAGVSFAAFNANNVAMLHFSGLNARGTSLPGRVMNQCFQIRCYSQPLKSAGVQHRIWQYGKPGILCIDGLLLDLKTHQITNAPTSLPCRRVDSAQAKPIRDTIDAWQQLGKTYFGLLDAWTPEHAAMFERLEAGYPVLGEEPTVEGLIRMLKTAVIWRMRAALGVNPPSWYTRFRTPTAIKTAYAGAFEKWKRHLYDLHDVYKTVDVTFKKAA